MKLDNIVQPAPALRFSHTKPQVHHGAHAPGADGEAVLLAAGFAADEIQALRQHGAVISA